jgi:lipid-binding SYLF domain-containing protein
MAGVAVGEGSALARDRQAVRDVVLHLIDDKRLLTQSSLDQIADGNDAKDIALRIKHRQVAKKALCHQAQAFFYGFGLA